MTARFHPSYANKFYKVAEIHYILKCKFECEDIAKQKWQSVTKADRIAPISGLGGRWFDSLSMRLNQHPVTSPAQDNILQNFIKSKLTIPDEVIYGLGSLEGLRRDIISPGKTLSL